MRWLERGMERNMPAGLLDNMGEEERKRLQSQYNRTVLAEMVGSLSGRSPGYMARFNKQVPGLLEEQQRQQAAAQQQQRHAGLLDDVDQLVERGYVPPGFRIAIQSLDPDAAQSAVQEVMKRTTTAQGSANHIMGHVTNTQDVTAVQEGQQLTRIMGEHPPGSPEHEAAKARLAQHTHIPERASAVDDKKIASLVRQGVPQARSENLTYGRERIEIVQKLGVARYINDVTGRVDEVPLGSLTSGEIAMAQFVGQPGQAPQGQPGQAPQGQPPMEQPLPPSILAPPEGQSTMGLYQAAELGTGPWSAGRDLYSKFSGFDPTGTLPSADKTTQSRAFIELTERDLVRALSNNHRYPVAEANSIRRNTQIAPELFDNPKRMIGRLEQLEDYLRSVVKHDQRLADDPNTPMAERTARRQNIHDMQALLSRFGERPGSEGQPAQPQGDNDLEDILNRWPSQ